MGPRQAAGPRTRSPDAEVLAVRWAFGPMWAASLPASVWRLEVSIAHSIKWDGGVSGTGIVTGID